MEEILIDDKTRQMLLDCDRQVLLANQRMQDICQTIFNMKGIDTNNGNWQLSQDRTKLFKVLVPEKE